jgi:hypothetical protein
MSVQAGSGEDYRHEQNAGEDDAATDHPRLLLCDDVVEGDDIPEVQTRIDLLRKGGDAGRKQRRVPRDAHAPCAISSSIRIDLVGVAAAKAGLMKPESGEGHQHAAECDRAARKPDVPALGEDGH